MNSEEILKQADVLAENIVRWSEEHPTMVSPPLTWRSEALQLAQLLLSLKKQGPDVVKESVTYLESLERCVRLFRRLYVAGSLDTFLLWSRAQVSVDAETLFKNSFEPRLLQKSEVDEHYEVEYLDQVNEGREVWINEQDSLERDKALEVAKNHVGDAYLGRSRVVHVLREVVADFKKTEGMV